MHNCPLFFYALLSKVCDFDHESTTFYMTDQYADITFFMLQVNIAMVQRLNRLNVRLVAIVQTAPCFQLNTFVRWGHLTTGHLKHPTVPVHDVGQVIIVNVKV